MQKKALIMDEAQMRRSLTRMAHEIIERNKGVEDVVLVGIRRRGEPLAQWLADAIQRVEGPRPPVGIVDMMSDVGSQSATAWDAAWTLCYLTALIAVNLAVMNLLPLPALDGGRILFLLVNGVLYGLCRKKLDPKYEGYVQMAGLAALMCLSVMVLFSDIGRILGR